MEHDRRLRPGGGAVPGPGPLDHADALSQGGIAQVLRRNGSLVGVGTDVNARQLGGLSQQEAVEQVMPARAPNISESPASSTSIAP